MFVTIVLALVVVFYVLPVMLGLGVALARRITREHVKSFSRVVAWTVMGAAWLVAFGYKMGW